jgi:hypothetical protein
MRVVKQVLADWEFPDQSTDIQFRPDTARVVTIQFCQDDEVTTGTFQTLYHLQYAGIILYRLPMLKLPQHVFQALYDRPDYGASAELQLQVVDSQEDIHPQEVQRQVCRPLSARWWALLNFDVTHNFSVEHPVS